MTQKLKLIQRFVLVKSLLLLLTFTAFPLTGDAGNPKIPDLKQYVKQAEKLYKRGEKAEAENLYKQALALDKNYSPAQLGLAYIYVKTRRLSEAYEISFDIAKKDPKNAQAFAILGLTFLANGNFIDARQLLLSALDKDRNSSTAWSGLGTLSFYENNIDKSVEYLREAVWLDSDDPDARFALAQACTRAELFKDAAEQYRQYLQIVRTKDDDRRKRVEGLIEFLNYLGTREKLYRVGGNSETSIDINIVNDRPLIKVKINDNETPLNFVLDTGSGMTVISDRTAERLKLKAVARGGNARGIGGNGKFEIVYGFIRKTEIGGVEINNTPVYIRPFHGGADSIDGYIGLSMLSKFLATIDYGSKKFELRRKSDSKPVQSEKTVLQLPLRLTSSGFLSGEVTVDGVESTLNFIVDTGASVSVISKQLATHDALSQFLQDTNLKVIGSAGVATEVRSFMLPRVTFGSHTRENISAVALDLDIINESSGFEQSGILGGNFLRNYKLTFDFRASKVIFEPSVKQERD